MLCIVYIKFMGFQVSGEGQVPDPGCSLDTLDKFTATRHCTLHYTSISSSGVELGNLGVPYKSIYDEFNSIKVPLP